MAVRLAAALNPARPNWAISIDGIDSESGLFEVVAEALRSHAKRASLTHLGLRTLASVKFNPWVREILLLVFPGGLAWPVPIVSES